MDISIRDLKIINKALILLSLKQAAKVDEKVALIAKVDKPQELKHLQYKIAVAKANMDETEKLRSAILETIKRKHQERGI